MSFEQFEDPRFRKEYEKEPITFSEIVLPNILELIKKIEGKKILDLGCGSGRFSSILAKKGTEVLGIDLSKGWIEEAIKKYGEIENLVFQQKDASNLEKIEKEKFDIIIMNMVFIEINSKEKVKKYFEKYQES